MRINKFLAQAGIASRRGADKLIESGKVTINGKQAQLGDQVSASDTVKVQNKVIQQRTEKNIYLAFHKPIGVITTADPSIKHNIMSFFKKYPRIFPVGRLDVATSGLIFLTNDGDFTYKITHAKHGVQKEYIVTLDRKLESEDKEILEKGVKILGKKTAPAIIKGVNKKTVHITIQEGKNRQIRRMFASRGYDVEQLQRIRIGEVRLKSLPPGEHRELTKKEIASF